MVNPLGLMFALAFLVAGYSVFLIEERSNKFLHLQQVCGLYKGAYWLAAYIWDSVSGGGAPGGVGHWEGSHLCDMWYLLQHYPEELQ